MAALPSHIAAAINARQPTRTDWIEDVEIRYGGRTTYFSVQAVNRLQDDGSRIIDRVLYDGKPVILPPGVVAMLEEILEEDDE